MPTTESEIVRGFAWEGPISFAAAVAILVALALAFAWLSWRERYAVGIRTVVCFWALRITAVAFVLWMLLEPTNLTRHITSSPQSIAVLVDRSDSMSVVDPAGRQEDVRWALAAQSQKPESSGDSFLADCDRAVVSLQMTVDHANNAAKAIDLHRPMRIARQYSKSIAESLDRTASHLQRVSKQLANNDTALSARAERIRSQLQGPIRETWSECDGALNRDQVVAAIDLTVRLNSLSNQLTSCQRRLSQLVRDAVDRQIAAMPSKELQHSVTMSRAEKVANVLEPLERHALRQLEDNVRVKRMSFAEVPSPVLDGADWGEEVRPNINNNDPTSTQEVATTAEDSGSAGHVGPTTDITAALKQLSQEAAAESLKSVYLITDGAHNQPDTLPPQEFATALSNVPVFIVPIGNDKPLRDLILHRVDAPTTVIEKDSIVVEAIVTAFACRGEQTEAILRHNGKQIDQQLLDFDHERINRRVTFRIPAEQLGRHEFEIAVKPVDDEASTRNNIASVRVEVIKDKMQLLLAHRINHWEFQFLEQLFPRDKRVQFDHLRFEPAIRATGALRRSGSLPRDVEGWSRYNAVILGDISPEHFDSESQESLEEYIRDRGGNLIVVAGRNNMPQAYARQTLAKLLPVQLDRRRRARDASFLLDLTMEGRRNTSLMIEDSPEASVQAWRNIYQNLPINFLSMYSRPKPSARTLIEAIPQEFASQASRSGENEIESAFLSWHNVGAGRVVYLAAPATYQLRYRRGDTYHHRFWGQLLRWVMAGELAPGSDRLRIRTDKAQYVYGDHVQISVRTFDEQGQPVSDIPLEVVARPTEGSETVIELSPDRRVPGQYRGIMEGLLPGSYHLTPRGEWVDNNLPASTDVSAVINVSASESIEMLNTQCDRALLKQIAVATGGQVIPPTALSEVLQLTELSPEVSERVEREPLWNRWRYLFIVFGCLATEWFIRKRMGLA